MSKPTREQFADFFNEMFEPDSKPHDPPARPVPVYVVVAEEKKSTKEQFAEWADKCMNPQKEPEPREKALAALAKARNDYEAAFQLLCDDAAEKNAANIAKLNQIQQAFDSLASIPDGGEPAAAPNYHDPAGAFEEWAGNKLAYNPHRDQDGWTRLPDNLDINDVLS